MIFHSVLGGLAKIGEKGVEMAKGITKATHESPKPVKITPKHAGEELLSESY